MTKIDDGIYFVWPAGGCWMAAQYEHGTLVDTAEQSEVMTHHKARDKWADVIPDDESDTDVPADVAAAIARDVLGADADPEMVLVTRMTFREELA